MGHDRIQSDHPQTQRSLHQPAPNTLVGQYPGIPFMPLEDAYELTGQPLGKGGFGTVEKARVRKMGRLVAVKRLLPEKMQHVDVARFIREVQLAAPLQHPNITALLDYGQDQRGLFLVMELVLGEDLAKRLQQGPMSVAQICDVAQQVCAGLQVAHSSGVIHRDIKPANLLLDIAGVVKVCDFGIARRIHEPITVTQTGQEVLSRLFASPEQLRYQKDLDHRSDLYSLGATLFHLAVGPGVDDRVFDLQRVPGPLRSLLQLALAESRDQRFQTAEQFSAAALGVQQSVAAAGLPTSLPRPAGAVPVPAGSTKPIPPQPLAAPHTAKAALAAQQTWAESLGGPLDLTNSLGMKLRLIPPGTFLMGSPDGQGDSHEHPQHKVQLTQPFRLCTTLVTQAQYRKLMGTTPWKGKPNVKEGDQIAASYVTWDDAADFCRLLSEQEERTYRLPTEAEWEYACRAGTTTRYFFGDSDGRLEVFAWFDQNTQGPHAHPVGLKQANPFGLFDMHGNLWEWCQDYYDQSYYGKNPGQNPVSPASGSSRVLRGGSWNNVSAILRSAFRNGITPDFRNGDIGFRVLSELE